MCQLSHTKGHDQILTIGANVVGLNEVFCASRHFRQVFRMLVAAEEVKRTERVLRITNAESASSHLDSPGVSKRCRKWTNIRSGIPAEQPPRFAAPQTLRSQTAALPHSRLNLAAICLIRSVDVSK